MKLYNLLFGFVFWQVKLAGAMHLSIPAEFSLWMYMNDAMLGFIELERFLACAGAKPYVTANTERDPLALVRYDFDGGALLRFQRKTPMVSSDLRGSDSSYAVSVSEKTELDVKYFVLDENGLFVEACADAREIIRDFTGAELDSQEAFLDGMSRHYTYGVSTNMIEYTDAINSL